MLVPLSDKNELPDYKKHAINDLLHNAKLKVSLQTKGFNQKLIDILYNIGYYKYNDTIFLDED